MAHLNGLWEVSFTLGFILLTLGTTVLYWINSRNTGFTKVAVSAHGASILVIFGAALALAYSEITHTKLLLPYNVLLLVPLVSVLAAFKLYSGNKWLHICQLWNGFALLWASFIGSMAITNDWL